MSPSFSSLNLVFLGPEGSGKDTQAEMVANAYSIAHISTRELLQEQVVKETVAGRQIRDLLDGRLPIPDRLLAGLMLERLDREDCARGFLLTGYPGSMEQVGTLDGIVAELGRVIERVVYFDVSEAVLAERRQDAGAGSLGHELAIFNRGIRPVVELYRSRGLLLSVDGDRDVSQISNEIFDAVGMPVGA